MCCIKGLTCLDGVYRWCCSRHRKPTSGSTSTGQGAPIMTSKGVDYYSYIALPGTNINFTGPSVGSVTTFADDFKQNHLEIDSANLPLFTFTGTFQWDVNVNGTDICTRQQDIDSLTGNLGSGDFTMMMDTPAVIGADYSIAYGFYDAGSGIAGLPNSDQAWVTIVPTLANWMGDIAPPNSSEAEKPFSTFVLAAAHDGGMNTMDGIDVVTEESVIAIFIGLLSALLPVPGIGILLESFADNIMEDLAMTQKDTFTSMLDDGVRYFDFRPAYLAPGIPEIVAPKDNTLYHTHLVIPGARFDSFLSEVATFLVAHPNEVVVIRTSADGIEYTSTVPTADVITQFANAALVGTSITLGDSSSFQKSISELRGSGTRLILVQNNPKYDSYSDAAYATLTPAPIIASFANMSTAGQAGNDFTVLQCQGTSTSITDVLVYTALTAGGATSPLMATKASFDTATLPWIRQNALVNLAAQQNIIIMNDFIDGATTHTAFELSKARFTGQTSLPAAPSAPVDDVSTLASRSAAKGKVSKAEDELKKNQERESLLQSISSKHQDELAAKETVSEDEKSTHDVLEAARKEAEDVRKAQEQVLTLAKQRESGSLASDSVKRNALAKRTRTTKSPADQLSDTQTELDKRKSRETLLASIEAKHEAELSAKAPSMVSAQDKRTHGVLTAARKEARDVRKAQESVLEAAQKRVAEAMKK